MPLVKLSAAQINYIDSPPNTVEGGLSDGLPIFLIHGFSSSITDNWVAPQWVKFLNDQGLRVIALDNRGHGESEKFYSEDDYLLSIMARDAVDLLDHLEIEKTHVLGYSMGCRIASLMTMNHSSRIGRLILGGNGYGMIEGAGDWSLIRDGLLTDAVEDIEDARARAFRRFAERTGSDRRALAACVMGGRHLFDAEQFEEIVNPVLIAIGADDDLAGSGQKLADIMENARFFSIPNRDHMRASTDKLFKQEVADFLQP